MSFQTVLSIAVIVFTAIELYQRFRQKDSSGGGINAEHNSVQSPISLITEPKHSGAPSGAPSRALTQRSLERRFERSSERSGAGWSPEIGMV